MLVSTGEEASRVERLLIQLVIRHGEKVIFRDIDDGQGNLISLTVAQFIELDLGTDNLTFHNPLYTQILTEAAAHSHEAGFQCEQYFINHPDFNISQVAAEMSVDPYQFILSEKAEPRNEDERKEQEQQATDHLRNETKHLILDYRLEYVDKKMKQTMNDIKKLSQDPTRMMQLMTDYKDLQIIRNALAKELGNYIVI